MRLRTFTNSDLKIRFLTDMASVFLFRCRLLPCNRASFSQLRRKQCKRSRLAVACQVQSMPPTPEQQPPPEQQQDAKYIVKLLFGCAAGAAFIKYGSLLVPGVTSPNIAIAVTMVAVPVVVSLAILVAASQQGT